MRIPGKGTDRRGGYGRRFAVIAVPLFDTLHEHLQAAVRSGDGIERGFPGADGSSRQLGLSPARSGRIEVGTRRDDNTPVSLIVAVASTPSNSGRARGRRC